jgi:hypothetical protein
MPGHVHVFNCFSERLIILTVEGINASGSIPGWSVSPDTLYQPRSIRVPRGQHRLLGDPAKFTTGRNSLQMEWDSFTASTTLDFPGSKLATLEDDLIVHLCKNVCFLLTARGQMLAAEPCLVEWTFAKTQARG